jgi:hypothetical protein
MDESSQLARRKFVKRTLVITTGGGLMKFGSTKSFLSGPSLSRPYPDQCVVNKKSMPERLRSPQGTQALYSPAAYGH